MRKPLLTSVIGIVILLFVIYIGESRWEKKAKEYTDNVKIKEEKIVTKEKEKENTKIVLLGDSNTAISYFENTSYKKWATIIEEELDATVVNLGEDGRRVSDFLDVGENVPPTEYWIGENWKKTKGDYYIITFGLNDKTYYGVEEFRIYTKEIVRKVEEEAGGIPILMTNVYVPYPDYYSQNRNESIDLFDNVKRELAEELEIHLIDVNKRLKKEWEENNLWDTRIRNTDVLDNSQDEGKTVEEGWFDNIHYNEKGNEIVAEEVISYFNDVIFNK